MPIIKNPNDFTEKPSIPLVKDNQKLMLKVAELRSLKDVVKGIGAYAMRPIDSMNLESLVHSAPDEWDAIKVIKTQTGYIYYDGQHRVEASKILKREMIRAESYTFPNEDELIEATFRANLKHGLGASRETRSDYCYWLHVTYPDLNQREIADRVGVAQSTVSRAIELRTKQLQEAMQEQAASEEEINEDDSERLKEALVKRTKTLLREVSRFSGESKSTEYYSLVRELQIELLQEPEDRQALLFTGQLLLDAANRTKNKRG